MRRAIRRLIPVALLAIAALVSGCGDEPSPATPAAVRADITKALTGTEKDDCTLATYETRRFIDQATFSTPYFAETLEAFCRADVQDYTASSVRVTRIEVHGDRASARIEPKGGQEPYERHDAELVRDGVWKLDALTAVELDRLRLARRILWFALDDHPTVEQVGCIHRRLDRKDDAELETAIVQSDIELILDPVLVCYLRPMLRSAGVSLAATSCALRVLHARGISLLRASAESDDAVRQLMERVGLRRCRTA